MEKFKELLKDIRPRSFGPYVAAILVFLLLTIVYVRPVLEGQQLLQPDIVNWQGMAQEIQEHREETGEEPLWTNSMFGGMPAFQISVQWAHNIADFFHDVMTLWLPRPADMIFLYFAGFFIFLLMLKISPWIALAGAVGFAFSSYHFIIIEAGHNSKAVAIGYMAPVLGAIIYTFRGKLQAGGLLFAIFMALQLYANHFQMTYYLGFIVAFYGLFQLIRHYQEKQLPDFAKKLGVLVLGLVLAIGVNIGNFWGTYAYTSETMRGGTELTIRNEPVTAGLDRDYITAWSYGVGETFTLLIPNAKGGATGQLGANEKALEEVDPRYQQAVAQANHYWGDQPFTSGPVYVGAVVLFFFFLALFYVKGPLKWALLAATVLSVMLAWGKNFMPLTDFFIDFVPGYNKFRAVSMTLVIAELCIPALAFLGVYKLYQNPGSLSFRSKAFITATSLTAGVAFLFYLAPRLFFSFISEMEAEQFAGMAAQDPAMSAQINEYVQNLEQARISVFRSDAFRSFLFVAAAAVITLFFAYQRLAKMAFVALVVVLITIDMWPVNRRYLNDDDFEPRRRVERPYPMRPADQHILEDDDIFRVLDITENTFNSARTAYYHHAIGGYHGAKLQRYQDLIDFHIRHEMETLQQLLNRGVNQAQIEQHLRDKHVLNMLNTRYILHHPETPPVRNLHAAGNAWLVSDYEIVPDADEELLALEEINPAEKAVIDQRFAKHLEEADIGDDPAADISLVDYQPNKLKYKYNSNAQQLAIFSEIYYPDGWQVTINGEETDHFRANYILRAMVLPPGEYTIEFSFKPRSYYTGQYIALAFSMILAAGIIAYAIIQWRKMIKDRKTKRQKDEMTKRQNV